MHLQSRQSEGSLEMSRSPASVRRKGRLLLQFAVCSAEWIQSISCDYYRQHWRQCVCCWIRRNVTLRLFSKDQMASDAAPPNVCSGASATGATAADNPRVRHCGGGPECHKRLRKRKPWKYRTCTRYLFNNSAGDQRRNSTQYTSYSGSRVTPLPEMAITRERRTLAHSALSQVCISRQRRDDLVTRAQCHFDPNARSLPSQERVYSEPNFLHHSRTVSYVTSRLAWLSSLRLFR